MAVAICAAALVCDDAIILTDLQLNADSAIRHR